MRINVSMPQETADAIRELAWQQRKSTSRLVSELITKFIEQQEESEDE